MNAPENSNTAAVSTACRSDRAPDPTEVPIAFATSFAPMFQAMQKPNSKVIYDKVLVLNAIPGTEDGMYMGSTRAAKPIAAVIPTARRGVI